MQPRIHDLLNWPEIDIRLAIVVPTYLKAQGIPVFYLLQHNLNTEYPSPDIGSRQSCAALDIIHTTMWFLSAVILYDVARLFFSVRHELTAPSACGCLDGCPSICGSSEVESLLSLCWLAIRHRQMNPLRDSVARWAVAWSYYRWVLRRLVNRPSVRI